MKLHLSSFALIWSVQAAIPLVVWGAPALSVTPTTVTASGPAGSAIPSQTVQVRNTGTGPLKWSASPISYVPPPSNPPQNWLTISPTKGTNNSIITLSFSTANVPIGGPYTAKFSVSAPNIAPQTVTVQLTVTSPPPPPPPSPSAIGPQDIPCPAGAFDVYPGYDIQNVVANALGMTTFCLHAGFYAVNSPIIPKTGNTSSANSARSSTAPAGSPTM